MLGIRLSYLLALGVIALTAFSACTGSSTADRSGVEVTTGVAAPGSPTADEADVGPTPDPWPSDYMIPVNDDVVVKFPYDDYGGRLSNIFITHIASTAYINVDSEGDVVSLNREPAPEVLTIFCEVLADESVMSKVYARANELFGYFDSSLAVVPDPCAPSGPPTVTGTPTISTPSELEAFYEQSRLNGDDLWPEEYLLVVNDEVEIRFKYPIGNRMFNFPILILHVPTASRVEIDLEGTVLSQSYGMNADAVRSICDVVSDEMLMDGVFARAVEIGVYWMDGGPSPYGSDICESSSEP